MTIKMFSALSGKVPSSAICGSVSSKIQSGVLLGLSLPRSLPAEPPQCPRSCQQLTGAEAAQGRGHRFVLSNSRMQWDQTFPTADSQDIHIYALTCDGGGEDSNSLEWKLLVQSYCSQKALFCLSNALPWLVEVSLNLSYSSHTE